jgi:AcrR family transcriptional regulator
MAIQARAEATREKIIASAVDLFSQLGYGETGLSDVIDHAGVSKGAFYYHFESKEALAGAIIQVGTGQLLDLFKAITGAESPALQNTIAATFAIAELTRENSTARTANQLRQCLSQVSAAGSPTYRPTVDSFRLQVDRAIAEGDVECDVDPDDLAETICVSVLGCHLLSDAMGDDLFARLTRAWRIMLRGSVPHSSRRYSTTFSAALPCTI